MTENFTLQTSQKLKILERDIILYSTTKQLNDLI